VSWLKVEEIALLCWHLVTQLPTVCKYGITEGLSTLRNLIFTENILLLTPEGDIMNCINFNKVLRPTVWAVKLCV
jgi:hypothetical protein